MSTTHPQVGAYLDDLARMLTGIDPGERDDILASVREHLDAEIGDEDGGDAVVHAALLRLGPPEQVAAEARAGQPPEDAPRGSTAAMPHRGWAIAAIALTVTSTLPFTVATSLGRALRAADVGTFAGLYFGAAAMFVVWPVWVIAAACTARARRRIPTSWGMVLASGPLCFAVTVLATFWREPRALSAIVSIITLLAATGFTVVVARRAWRESSA